MKSLNGPIEAARDCEDFLLEKRYKGEFTSPMEMHAAREGYREACDHLIPVIERAALALKTLKNSDSGLFAEAELKLLHVLLERKA